MLVDAEQYQPLITMWKNIPKLLKGKGQDDLINKLNESIPLLETSDPDLNSSNVRIFREFSVKISKYFFRKLLSYWT